MRTFRSIALAGAVLGISACGDGDGGEPLEGTYYPQHPPGATRFDRSMSDTRWEFYPGNLVTTYPSQGMPRPWKYEIRGNEIRMTGSGPNTQGERRRFTFAENGCIWDGSGRSSVDTLFCKPAEPKPSE